jgi:hypothetical protein
MNTIKLLLAMMIVESGGPNGNDYAFNEAEQARGALQIRPIFVEDVNRIYHSHFTLEDCYDRKKSIRMVQLYWSHYATKDRLGHEPTWEDLARIHNGGGGNGWKKESTKPYWEKVKKELIKMGVEL